MICCRCLNQPPKYITWDKVSLPLLQHFFPLLTTHVQPENSRRLVNISWIPLWTQMLIKHRKNIRHVWWECVHQPITWERNRFFSSYHISEITHMVYTEKSVAHNIEPCLPDNDNFVFLIYNMLEFLLQGINVYKKIRCLPRHSQPILLENHNTHNCPSLAHAILHYILACKEQSSSVNICLRCELNLIQWFETARF